MLTKAVTFLAILTMASTMVSAQVPNGKFTVFTGKGQRSSMDEIMKSLENTDVVFLGELHDDAIAHAIQLEIFKRAIEQYGAKRRVTLSLEMFERDVQSVVNEYLAGLISEQHFLLSSRPWPRYKEDYRPLVELAKEKKLEVIAANAPRRYVNMVSRNGRDAVNGLSKEAKAWLAPLPYAEPSEAYSKKFKALMGSSMEASSMGIDKILSSQSLWDATMAHSVAQSLKRNRGSLVVHLNGGFHTEMRLGTVEHFLKYRKNARAVVVTMRYEDDFRKFDSAKHTDLGDFVILTQRQPKERALVPQILDRIDNNAKKLKTMQASVRMVKLNSQLKLSDEFKGTVAYIAPSDSKPFGVRIDWSRPKAEHLAIANNKYVLYLPGIRRAYAGNLGADAANASVARLYSFASMGRAEIRANFDPTYIGEAKLADDVRTWHLRFSPKKKEAFKSIEAWVDIDGMPRQIRVADHNGDSTTILLSEIQKNPLVPSETFTLKLPTGTQLIRG
ncbi:MAG TPA: ChaN family lipoprotein [Pyrinomonadaceae bacterium]